MCFRFNRYRSGFGEHKSPDGDLYVGAWKDGSRHGFGKLCLADGGHVFEGTWGHGNMVGIGTWTCQETGNSYKGKWERGVFEGSGQYVDKAAGVYVPVQLVACRTRFFLAMHSRFADRCTVVLIFDAFFSYMAW